MDWARQVHSIVVVVVRRLPVINSCGSRLFKFTRLSTRNGRLNNCSCRHCHRIVCIVARIWLNRQLYSLGPVGRITPALYDARSCRPKSINFPTLHVLHRPDYILILDIFSMKEKLQREVYLGRGRRERDGQKPNQWTTWMDMACDQPDNGPPSGLNVKINKKELK